MLHMQSIWSSTYRAMPRIAPQCSPIDRPVVAKKQVTVPFTVPTVSKEQEEGMVLLCI